MKQAPQLSEPRIFHWGQLVCDDANLLTDNDAPVNPITTANVCPKYPYFLSTMFDKRLPEEREICYRLTGYDTLICCQNIS